MDRMVKKRDELVTVGGNYIPVIGWRISKIEKVAWMMCAGERRNLICLLCEHSVEI